MCRIMTHRSAKPRSKSIALFLCIPSLYPIFIGEESSFIFSYVLLFSFYFWTRIVTVVIIFLRSMIQQSMHLKPDFGTPTCKVKHLVYEKNPGEYRKEIIDSFEVERENDPFTGGYSIIRSRNIGLRIS